MKDPERNIYVASMLRHLSYAGHCRFSEPGNQGCGESSSILTAVESYSSLVLQALALKQIIQRMMIVLTIDVEVAVDANDLANALALGDTHQRRIRKVHGEVRIFFG